MSYLIVRLAVKEQQGRRRLAGMCYFAQGKIEQTQEVPVK
jgi:hypothetical protein